MTAPDALATLGTRQHGPVPASGGPARPWGRGAALDESYGLLLIVALIVVVIAILAIRARMQREDAEANPDDSPFATSTEGMKVCRRCGMGNLWTDRTCVSCGAALKG